MLKQFFLSCLNSPLIEQEALASQFSAVVEEIDICLYILQGRCICMLFYHITKEMSLIQTFRNLDKVKKLSLDRKNLLSDAYYNPE